MSHPGNTFPRTTPLDDLVRLIAWSAKKKKNRKKKSLTND
jgi:hypothetical protein